MLGGENTILDILQIEGAGEVITMRLSLVYEVLCSKRWGEQDER
jgi:hypothetical protein